MSADLRRLLAPTSVAVIGASPRAGKAGHALVRSLADFRGAVYAVHPTATGVLGRPAFPTIAAIPEAVDLALLAIPASAVPDAVSGCVAAGVGGVVVHAGGFAEIGEGGAELQRRTGAVAAGTRLLGPNTSGFIAPPIGLCATFVSPTVSLRPGPLAIVAQSGGVNHALAFGAQADGLGIRLAVGLGNAVDVSFADVLDHLRTDPEVRVVALAIEGVTDGRRLIAAIERLVDNIPVVVTVLRDGAVDEFARSHTGALAGDQELTRAVLRRAGAVVLDDTTALLDSARALALRRLPPAARPGVGVVTGQAGPGLLLAGALATKDVHVPPLEGTTQKRLRQMLGELTFLRNPVDTGRPGANFAEVLRIVSGAATIDLIAAYVLHEPDALDVATVLADPAIGPLVLGTAGPPEAVAALRDRLASAGVCVLPTPERTATATAALIHDAWVRASRMRLSGIESVTRVSATTQAVKAPWDEARAKTLLNRLGIATPRRAVCSTHADAVAAAKSFGGSVALKLVHPELVHKTERGAVHLSLHGERDVREALHALDRIQLPSSGHYLVEAMATPGPELLISAVRNPIFGPIVTLAVGGITAELIADATFRLAPLSRDEAGSMLDDLATSELVRGHRGGPSVDEQALAEVIANLGALLHERADISEIEINPLRVTVSGLLALDALVVAA